MATQPQTRDEAQSAAVAAQSNKKPLSPGDLTTGLMYEREIATARARLEAHEQAQGMFLHHLRTQYEAPEEEWDITNWAVGFVKKS